MIKPPVNIKQMSKISVHICKCWTDIVHRIHCFHLGLMYSTHSLVSDIRPYADCHIMLSLLQMNSRCNSWHCMSDPMAESGVLLEKMCIYGIWQHRVLDTKTWVSERNNKWNIWIFMQLKYTNARTTYETSSSPYQIYRPTAIQMCIPNNWLSDRKQGVNPWHQPQQ